MHESLASLRALLDTHAPPQPAMLSSLDQMRAGRAAGGVNGDAGAAGASLPPLPREPWAANAANAPQLTALGEMRAAAALQPGHAAPPPPLLAQALDAFCGAAAAPELAHALHTLLVLARHPNPNPNPNPNPDSTPHS